MEREAARAARDSTLRAQDDMESPPESLRGSLGTAGSAGRPEAQPQHPDIASQALYGEVSAGNVVRAAAEDPLLATAVVAAEAIEAGVAGVQHVGGALTHAMTHALDSAIGKKETPEDPTPVLDLEEPAETATARRAPRNTASVSYEIEHRGSMEVGAASSMSQAESMAERRPAGKADPTTGMTTPLGSRSLTTAMAARRGRTVASTAAGTAGSTAGISGHSDEATAKIARLVHDPDAQISEADEEEKAVVPPKPMPQATTSHRRVRANNKQETK